MICRYQLIISYSVLICFPVKSENKKTYVLHKVWLSWPDAQAYCRTHYKDLATIESSEEQTNVYLIKPNPAWVWIGLYQTPWVWSDNSNSSFTNWFNGEPNNGFSNESCVSEDLQHKWFDNDCTMKSAFICHEGDCSLLHRNTAAG
uniref:C-type lectin domain-containing protein n=1 Tax=Amphilophus citrinellus TaxID=61819 RepID=A0A3Q0RSW6_AMPCI